MKHTWHSIVVAIALFAGFTTIGFASKQDLSSIDLSDYREVILTAYGLSCPLCAHNLDGQLTRIEGVENATIDLNTGAITVRLSEEHSVKAAQLTEAVDNAGFTLKRIEPSPDS